MMEGMNNAGEEEYILAMRSSAFRRDDSDLWRKRRSNPLTPGQSYQMTRRKTVTKGLIPMTDDHTTKVLASLVPDEIIYNVNDYSNRPYNACCLIADVSGFTDLCEMYNKTGKGGPSRLTVVLNSYIGALVQEIMSHNGDVLKFSGDAFLAMWKCGINDSMQDVVHEALDCAIIMQKSFGTYETDVGIFLRIKLAIAAGFVLFSIIGDAKLSHYAVVGQPILDIKAGEKKAHPGEIVVSSSAWHYLNPFEYIWDHVGDGIHIKVRGVGPSWRPSQRNVDKVQKHGNAEDEGTSLHASNSRLSEDDEGYNGSKLNLSMDQNQVRNEDFSDERAICLENEEEIMETDKASNYYKIIEPTVPKEKNKYTNKKRTHEETDDSKDSHSDIDIPRKKRNKLIEPTVLTEKVKYTKKKRTHEETDNSEDSHSDIDIPRRKKNTKASKPIKKQIRPSVNYAAKMNLKDDLRKFIIPPIMRGIDMDEPLEYLTEMRQIVIVFINVVVVPKMELPDYLELIDSAYIIVCNVVDDMQGCVNKVSAFDKDLMFVLLFGLRGYKNELESQIGLRCASECYHAISKLNGVLSTSVGVTTGVTYCGVVGHTLRREYTVISLTVNKAARLMVAYPDKVTCDRETFLHSKLESRNFILQEPKPLKGITNAGPVYEFKEQSVVQDKLAINPFPILGRSDEIRLYRRLLDECIDISKDRGKTNTLQMLNHHNTLLIRGDPRIGKTRLLDEYVYCTPSTVPVNRFTLTKRDAKVPYQTIQFILSMPLGLNELSSIEEREAKLKLRLQKIKVSDFFCALNKVFNVNFETGSLYQSLSNAQKATALQKMLKQLCYIGFITLWVVAIDNAEYIDDESWNFLYTMLELDVAFLVMTISNLNELSNNALTTVHHRRVRIMDLKPVDKWYHAGLACQILDVHAIPPELEKLIQSRSSGNPGWIESFLVSLMQAGGLVVQYLSKTEINELGLVSPPIDMMVRLTPEEMKDLEEASSSKDGHLKKNEVQNKADGWKMYKFSYRDSIINLMKEKIREKRLLFGSLIPVCIIAPTFKLEEVDPELSMDVMIIKMFDSLTSYEQLLLKCSSVLGEYFPREMLLYIMASSTPRSTALAVQKLFELRVLGCAHGDFTQGDTCMMFLQRLGNPNQDFSTKCDCKGLKIHETCLDLPKYASCGFLRFRLTMFRDTTYNLLTDNQKKEFHNRAIRYLEKETRRCRACGNGFFVRILGTRNDDGFIRKLQRKPQEKVPRNRRQSVIITAKSSQEISLGSQSSSVDYNQFANLRPLQRKDTFGNVVVQETSNVGRRPSDIFYPRYCLGLGMIQKLRYSISLTRTFSYADFSSCQCPLILNTMYTQMLEHCKGAVQLEKMMNAMLEYSYICIISCNVPQAMKILEDAKTILEQKSIQKDEDGQEAAWKIPLIWGKIETLIGYARLELGQLEEAYACLQKALKYYGLKFPSGKLKLKFNVFVSELKQRFGMYLFPTMFVATVDGYESEFCDNVAECLSLLCHLFKELQMWEHAEFAAAWSLNKSLESDMDFFGLCTSYANMLEVAQHLGKEHFCVALEIHALRLCHRKKSSVESQELKAVSQLYGAIFCSRLLRSEIERSIHIGFVMLRICATIHAIQVSLKVLPLLVHALLIRSRISEAVTMIMELEYCSEEDTDNSGRTWFFALCVVLQLESGYTLVPFKKCENFYQIQGDTLMNIRDPDAERRFYTVMWLWCVRNEDWEAATVWYTKASTFVIHSDDSLNNIFTALYLLEGLLLYVVGKMDKRNVQAIAAAYEEINSLIHVIEKASQICKIVLPRLCHLKAYYKFIRNDEARAFNLLSKTKSLADKHDNLLEIAWANHSEKAWSNNLSSILIDFWKEHCDPDNLMDYHEVDLNDGKLGLYTLPIPMYY